MEKELYIKKLKPFLYLMDEAHEATGYIVVGDERVCVIDLLTVSSRESFGPIVSLFSRIRSNITIVAFIE